MPLSHDDILALHSAAITAGLDRDDLLAGVHPHFRASIKRSSSRSGQLRQDLDAIHSAGPLTDGSQPLVIWLKNAVQHSAGRPEETIFRSALSQVAPDLVDPIERVLPSPMNRTEFSAIVDGGKPTVNTQGPYAWTQQAFRDVRDALVTNYDEPHEVSQFARDVGIPVGHLKVDSALNAWNSLLSLAIKLGKVETVLGHAHAAFANPNFRRTLEALMPTLKDQTK